MNALDLLLLLGAATFGLVGYRQGFIVGLFSLTGFLGGAVLALVATPHVFDQQSTQASQSFFAVAIVLIVAAVAQLLFASVGHMLRRRMTSKPARAVDAAVGAAVSVLALLMVTWFLASALRPGPSAALSRQISESAVVTGVDQVMPDRARTLFSSFRRVLNDNPLPPVFGGVQPERIRPVEPPERKVALSPAITAAARSVVEVTSTSEECRRTVNGTGFVYAPRHVMTNAHVVAGVRRPEVKVQGSGREYPARVVVYDPGRDLAVLYVPELPTPALAFREGGRRGMQAVVAGYPRGGPFELEAARIRETITARGPDIYQSRQVNRQVYSLYADVEPGNSGGPLLSLKGDVLGVIFAKSLDDADTGYALTAKEVAPVAAKGRAATKAVSTRTCV